MIKFLEEKKMKRLGRGIELFVVVGWRRKVETCVGQTARRNRVWGKLPRREAMGSRVELSFFGFSRPKAVNPSLCCKQKSEGSHNETEEKQERWTWKPTLAATVARLGFNDFSTLEKRPPTFPLSTGPTSWPRLKCERVRNSIEGSLRTR